jgi:hypothetical protein
MSRLLQRGNPMISALFSLLLVLASGSATAQNQSDADEDRERTRDVEPNQQSNIEPVGAEKKRKSEFLAGSEIVIKPRTYYLDRDRDINPDTAGWALGGAVEWRSGWWRDRLRLGTTVFTSQDLYGPSDEDGTQLFKPGPEGFTVLGEAYATLRLGGLHGMRLGRQRFEMPYLGSHDIRMVPNTFEAVAFGNRPDDGFAYLAGYVDKIKRKNDDEFINMSVAAGAEGSNKGVGFAGARYRLADGSIIGAVNQHTFDLFNTFFAKAEKYFRLPGDERLFLGMQYTDQRSTGEELIGDFSTHLLALKAEWIRGATTLRGAYSSAGSEKGIQKPYGNPANYLSVIVEDFDRAAENAWLLGVSQQFGRLGPGNLSLFANIVSGNTPDSGPNASADQKEYDLTLDWRLDQGWSDRIWVRIRGAWVDQDSYFSGANDFFDFRIIVNYDFDVL